jgi:hypothetical protein
MVSSKPVQRRRRAKRTNNVMTASFFVRKSTMAPTAEIDHVKKDIEMSSMNNNQTENNDSDDEAVYEDESKQEPSEARPKVNNPMMFITKIEKLDKNDDDIKQEDDDNNIKEDHLMLPKEEDTVLDWIRFGRAIDRISRFILPIVFIVGTFSLYNETSNHCIPGLNYCYNEKVEGMKSQLLT